MQINTTQAAGLLAFIPAAAAAGGAYWAIGREGRAPRRYWGAMAAIQLILTIEIMGSFRHQLNLVIGGWLQADGLYGERRPAQAAVIVATLLLALALTALVVRNAPTRAQALAAGATAGAVIVFAIECISLHAVDAYFYRPVGPIMAIGWLWLACGWTTAANALADTAASLRLRRNCV